MGGISKEQFAQVLELVSIQLAKPKGDKGDKGDKPKKGVDFWTKEDIEILVSMVHNRVKIPKAGKDFYTKEDREKMVRDVAKGFAKLFKSKLGEIKKYNTTIIRKAAASDTTGLVQGVGVGKITVSKSEPLNPSEGDLWVDIR